MTDHLVDAQKLQADGYVELFEIVMSGGGVLRMKQNDTVTWQGNTYEAWAVQIDSMGRSSDQESRRPKLTIANPDGIYSALVDQGAFTKAQVTRIRVLRTDLLANLNVARRWTWVVGRVVTLTHQVIQLELRSQIDGQFFVIPARMFIPPDFPQVSLN